MNVDILKVLGIILTINLIFVTLGVIAIYLTGIDIIGVFIMLVGVSVAAVKGSRYLEENDKK